MGAIALAAIVMVVGNVYIKYAELQQAADISAASMARPTGDDPTSLATSIARANGADSLEVDGDHIVVHRRLSGLKLFGHALASVRLRATADIPSTPVMTGGGCTASGTPYHGALVMIDSAVICPRVAADYRAMQRAAAFSGVRIWAVSGWRSVAEQAVLYARLGPRLAAPPGRSLHHAATELDLSVGGPTYGWLTVHAREFNFIQRYSWEPWHWGSVRGC